jgi:hypothetical protein
VQGVTSREVPFSVMSLSVLTWVSMYLGSKRASCRTETSNTIVADQQGTPSCLIKLGQQGTADSLLVLSLTSCPNLIHTC